MTVKLCPICGSFLEQQEITVGGSTDLYWVCPEGDWEDPVVDAISAPESKADES